MGSAVRDLAVGPEGTKLTLGDTTLAAVREAERIFAEQRARERHRPPGGTAEGSCERAPQYQV